MSIEPIGLATVILGLFCLTLRYELGAAILLVTSLLGAAAALLIGAANIQPAHLLLAFVAVTTLSRRREVAATLATLKPLQPGFYLACLLLYGVLSSVLLPRLLAGSTQIIPLGTSSYEPSNGGVPLGPVSSNFTQSVYLTADLICFCLTVVVASSRSGFVTLTKGMIAFAVANALFALIDYVTYSTGTQAVLDVIRNAQYTMHNEEEVAGLKRIVGSFPEASAFARTTLAAFAFTATLWLGGRYSSWSGPLAIVSLVLLILSTSSTGMAGAVPVVGLLYVTAMVRCGGTRSSGNSAATVLLLPLLGAIAVLVVFLNESLYAAIRGYLDLLIFTKATTSSGIERASWNAIALRNFWESHGLGVGLGTVRTSSFPVALLSNVGIPGTLLYGLFLLSVLRRRRESTRSFPSDVRMAARNACLSLIIGDALAAPAVEQGLLFFMLAAIACAVPEREAAKDARTVEPVVPLRPLDRHLTVPLGATRRS